jgi:hypothetical protein
MRNKYENVRNQYDLPTYMGPWGPKDQAIGDVR